MTVERTVIAIYILELKGTKEIIHAVRHDSVQNQLSYTTSYAWSDDS